jgi:hypothetical protein
MPGKVPYAGHLIPLLSPALKARLFAAFDLAILWTKDKAQATVTVTITDALAELLNPAQPGTTTPPTPIALGT